MQIKDLSLSFGMQEVFKDINLYINEKEKVGIVGVNGAGKSTLFKVILGLIIPDNGKIILNNSRIGYLPQVINDEIPDMDITVFSFLMSGRPIEKLSKDLQKVYEEIGIESDLKKQKLLFDKVDKIQKKLEYYEYEKAESILLKIIDGMHLDDMLDQKLNELSGGQKSKVSFAKLLYSKPEIILLDEPTNHLDESTKEFVINYLKNYKDSVYVISHDIKFLNEITTKTLYLDKRTKKMELYDGNYDNFIKLHKAHEEALLKASEIQEKDIKKLEDIVLKYSNSSGKRKKMAQDREKKLDKLLQNKIELKPKEKYAKINIDSNLDSNKVPLNVENLYFKYDESKDYIINNLSFEIMAGEKFLVLGVNGAGKSTLLKLIYGKLEPNSGIIKIGNKMKIGYYAQEHELLDEDKTIMDNFKDLNISDRQLRNVLGRFLFFDDDVFKKVKVLSPGEKSRVALAKLSLSNANFLILDEPTNHLDPETQLIIAETFKEFKGTMLVVSHNLEFVDNLGIERTLILPSGRIEFYSKDVVKYYETINSKK